MNQIAQQQPGELNPGPQSRRILTATRAKDVCSIPLDWITGRLEGTIWHSMCDVYSDVATGSY